MDILKQLPTELKFNVLKYLRHPTADIMNELIEFYDEHVLEWDPEDTMEFSKFCIVQHQLLNVMVRGIYRIKARSPACSKPCSSQGASVSRRRL